ncbi:MAG: TRL domain-containing protein [Candidatus Gastranaerophilales bacterium]|nr:TRL domain-containing protein [Candidatus Gastranaerophilales bacterium]
MKINMDEKVKEFLLTGILAVFILLLFNAIMSNGVYNNYRTSMFAMENVSKYPKVGKATMVNYFGLARFGDDSYQTALKDGGISKIHHVDTEAKGTIFKKVMTTYVYGE